jgi:hypothetical protein
MIHRRAFIALLGGAAAWPLARRGCYPKKLPTIVPLVVASLVRRLHDLGRIECYNIAIEYRCAPGGNEPLAGRMRPCRKGI